LPGIAPTATPFPESTIVSQAPSPTSPPHHELIKRNISPNICGWIDGKLDEPFVCSDEAATCLWNSKRSLVGCMTSVGTDLPPLSKSCIDFTAQSSDMTASISSDVQVCPSTAPYCNTVTFPNSYMMYPCGATKTSAISIALAGSGLPTPVSLPQYLNKSGKVYYEAYATDTSWQGSIIAACVGGGVLLLGLPFGIKMVIRKRNWRKAEKAPKIRNLKHPFVQKQLPPGPNFLFSQEWHGVPDPLHPKAQLSSGGHQARGNR